MHIKKFVKSIWGKLLHNDEQTEMEIGPNRCAVKIMRLNKKRKEGNNMNITKTLDAKGLACPMPIVKTKKAMDTLIQVKC